MVELTYLSLKKTTFFVRIFDISHCVFTKISIGRASWMRNLIPHPTSTHTAYFWWTLLPQKQEILEKCDDDIIIIMFFSDISCFWGSEVRQKYAVQLLVGCIIKLPIQRHLSLKIWVKTQGDMSKIRTKEVFFLWYLSPNLY